MGPPFCIRVRPGWGGPPAPVHTPTGPATLPFPSPPKAPRSSPDRPSNLPPAVSG
jgi:hypothetical protein